MVYTDAVRSSKGGHNRVKSIPQPSFIHPKIHPKIPMYFVKKLEGNLRNIFNNILLDVVAFDI